MAAGRGPGDQCRWSRRALLVRAYGRTVGEGRTTGCTMHATTSSPLDRPPTDPASPTKETGVGSVRSAGSCCRPGPIRCSRGTLGAPSAASAPRKPALLRSRRRCGTGIPNVCDSVGRRGRCLRAVCPPVGLAASIHNERPPGKVAPLALFTAPRLRQEIRGRTARGRGRRDRPCRGDRAARAWSAGRRPAGGRSRRRR